HHLQVFTRSITLFLAGVFQLKVIQNLVSFVKFVFSFFGGQCFIPLKRGELVPLVDRKGLKSAIGSFEKYVVSRVFGHTSFSYALVSEKKTITCEQANLVNTLTTILFASFSANFENPWRIVL